MIACLPFAVAGFYDRKGECCAFRLLARVPPDDAFSSDCIEYEHLHAVVATFPPRYSTLGRRCIESRSRITWWETMGISRWTSSSLAAKHRRLAHLPISVPRKHVSSSPSAKSRHIQPIRGKRPPALAYRECSAGHINPTAVPLCTWPRHLLHSVASTPLFLRVASHPPLHPTTTAFPPRHRHRHRHQRRRQRRPTRRPTRLCDCDLHL